MSRKGGWGRAGLLLLAITSTACMPLPAGNPPFSPKRPLGFDTEAPFPDEVQGTLTLPADLAEPLGVAVVWLEHRSASPALYPPGQGAVEVAEREDLVGDFKTMLSARPFGAVSTLDRDLDSLRRGGAGLLESVRAVAGELGHDVVVVLRTRSHESRQRNALGFTQILVWTAGLLPSEDLRVAAVAEACALHVRTGARLACAEREAVVVSPFARPWDHPRHYSDARRLALREALGGLSFTLREQVLAQIERTPPGAVSDGFQIIPPPPLSAPLFPEDILIPAAPSVLEAPPISSPAPSLDDPDPRPSLRRRRSPR